MVKVAGTKTLLLVCRRASERGMQRRIATDVLGNLAPYAGHVLTASGLPRERAGVLYYPAAVLLKKRGGGLVKLMLDVPASDWHQLQDLTS